MSSPEEKREAKRGRRKFRHEIARRMRRIAVRRIGLMATGPQLQDATKILTDRYMHNLAHVPARVVPHLSPSIPERQSATTESESIAVNG